MINLHLRAFVPRWRFLYAVSFDAYAFEIDEKTEQVLTFDCSHTLELTQRFLQDLFVGQHFPSIDSWLEETLARRYGGTSRRALVVSYRVALNRYQAMKRGEDL